MLHIMIGLYEVARKIIESKTHQGACSRKRNKLAETAFAKPFSDGYEIRWFTPEIEMDLCGHATLASAHVIVRHLDPSLSSVKFYSKSGILTVSVEDELLVMDFPSRKPVPSDIPQLILDAVKAEPIEVYLS